MILQLLRIENVVIHTGGGWVTYEDAVGCKAATTSVNESLGLEAQPPLRRHHYARVFKSRVLAEAGFPCFPGKKQGLPTINGLLRCDEPIREVAIVQSMSSSIPYYKEQGIYEGLVGNSRD